GFLGAASPSPLGTHGANRMVSGASPPATPDQPADAGAGTLIDGVVVEGRSPRLPSCRSPTLDRARAEGPSSHRRPRPPPQPHAPDRRASALTGPGIALTGTGPRSPPPAQRRRSPRADMNEDFSRPPPAPHPLTSPIRRSPARRPARPAESPQPRHAPRPAPRRPPAPSPPPPRAVRPGRADTP